MDKFKHSELVEDVLKWVEKKDPNQTDEWIGYAKRYMKRYGWNEKAISDFIDWGENGFNNDLLHFKTTIKEFYSEIMYCSDRMSLDRLFRCHCAYRTLKK